MKVLLNKIKLKIMNNKIRIISFICVPILLALLAVCLIVFGNENRLTKGNHSSNVNSSKINSSKNIYSKPQLMWGDTPLDEFVSSSEYHSSSVSSNSQSDNVSGNQSNNVSSNQTDYVHNNSVDFSVTGTANVSDGVCVVVGYCPINTEKIVVSGTNVQKTEIIPYTGKDKKYFMGQVRFTASTNMNFAAVEKKNKTTEVISKYVYYNSVQGNLMHSGEYVPVFSNNSQVHFYSALLSYSLSTSNFSQDMRSAAEHNVDTLISVAKDVGAEPIFLIIPTSADIYPETVPSEFSHAKGQRLFDEFKRIAEGKGAKVIYPLETMKAHRNDGVGYQIYQHTDSHWSAYGAYWGTYDLFKYISGSFPNAKPRTISEMGFYTTEMYGGDALFNLPKGLAFEKDRRSARATNSRIMELTTLYSLEMPTSTLRNIYHSNTALYLNDDNAAALTVENHNGTDLPTAAIMRDSFGKIAFDMINDRFKTVYWGEFDNYILPSKTINKVKPDYVIYMYSERNLLKIMLGNSNATMLTLR